MSAGAKLRDAVAKRAPLQIPGAINAYCALLAERAGFEAIYLSGAGVANASFGLPDLGVTTLNDVLEDARRITAATDLPLLVDADTGFGSAFNIARTVRELKARASRAMHIEDQEQRNAAAIGRTRRPSRPTRCATASRLRSTLAPNPAFVIMARTDAIRREGIGCGARARGGVRRGRGRHGVRRGALHARRLPRVHARDRVPVLANLTEFGLTPLFTCDELGAAGVKLILYPLSAFRAMSRAALEVYTAIRERGHAEAGRREDADARRALHRARLSRLRA